MKGVDTRGEEFTIRVPDKSICAAAYALGDSSANKEALLAKESSLKAALSTMTCRQLSDVARLEEWLRYLLVLDLLNKRDFEYYKECPRRLPQPVTYFSVTTTEGKIGRVVQEREGEPMHLVRLDVDPEIASASVG